MKNTFLTLLVLCQILLTSCGSNNEDDPTENLPDVEKLIKQITVQNPEFPDFYNPDKFIYENNKLVKAWFYGCSGALYEFEYGSNGKISTVYSQNSVSYSDINTSIKSTGEITKHIYDNQENLISITDDTGKLLGSFDYDSNGRLFKIQEMNNGLDNGKLGTAIFSNFDSNDNPLKMNFGLSYTYDDKVNPIYVLFKKYGFFNVEMCNSFEEIRIFYVSPNNVKEIIDTDDNNEIIFSAIYSYDSDGYPTSNSFTSKSGSDHSDVENYEY